MISNHDDLVAACRGGCIDLCHAIERHAETDDSPDGDPALVNVDRELLAWRCVKAARLIMEDDPNRCISGDGIVLQPLRDIERELAGMD